SAGQRCRGWRRGRKRSQIRVGAAQCAGDDAASRASRTSVVRKSVAACEPRRGLVLRKAGKSRKSCENLQPRWNSDSETVEIAIPLDIHREIRVVIRPFLVFGEFDVAHGVGEALMRVSRLSHCC